jgi:hypothetical protein
MDVKHLTRRDFLRGTMVGVAGLAASGAPAVSVINKGSTAKKTVVAVARSAGVLNAAQEIDKAAAVDVVRQAVAAAVGTKAPLQAWKQLFKPGDIVGIVTTRAVTPVHPELVDAVKAELIAAGVPEANIRMPQRDIAMARECTALIAMPSLKAHWLTGAGTVMKLYILYSGKASEYHMENSAKLGEIWNLDFLKGKTRLTIIDALRPLCDKGPQPDPRYLWNYNGVIASTDPVAAETIGLKIIQAKRDEIKGEPWPLSPPPLCVEAADKQYGLGTSDLAKIQIKKLGWSDAVLV